MDARCLLYISARFILSAHALEASSFHIAFVYVEYWTRMASKLLVMSQIMLWRPPHQKWEQTKWTFEATKHVSDSIGISDGSAFFPPFLFLGKQLHLRHLSVKPLILAGDNILSSDRDEPTYRTDHLVTWTAEKSVDLREKKSSSTLITLCDSPVDSGGYFCYLSIIITQYINLERNPSPP